jgi:hypothetical protein
MLHLKSYPRESKFDHCTDLEVKYNYPCLATDWCDFFPCSISLYSHPFQIFGCSVLQQCLCMEVRGCCKLGTPPYPCECQLDGGGYVLKCAFPCLQMGCMCCCDQLCMSKCQLLFLAQESMCCPSIYSPKQTLCSFCFYTTIPTDQKGWCRSFEQLQSGSDDILANSN